MSVYFVYRSPYDDPNLNRVKRFDDDLNVLTWFQRIWKPADPDAAFEYAKKLLGFDVYGFSSLFEEIQTNNLRAPQTWEELGEYLKKYLYVEEKLIADPHVIQVLTNDDEIQLAYYIFDDRYVEYNPDRASFLLHDWRLPETFSQKSNFERTEPTFEITPSGHSEGSTYFVFIGCPDGGNLTDYRYSWRFDGVRLPEFAQFLLSTAPDFHREEGQWPVELLAVWQRLDADTPDLEPVLESMGSLPWMHMETQYDKFAGSDLLDTRDDVAKFIESCPPEKTADLSKTKSQFSKHIAQLSVHVSQTQPQLDWYHRWFFFDDLWASEHQDLANAILCYGNQWDVLS
ncbi:MAG TPA: hypothetical protein V6C81_10685 [Planktothrix sp.]|jgi:hypothetical protein